MKQGHKGLFAFTNMTRGRIGRSSIVVRFSEDVTDLHHKQLYDAIYGWLLGQKLLIENSGVPPTREQIDARMRDIQGGVAAAGPDAVQGDNRLHAEAAQGGADTHRAAGVSPTEIPPDRK